MVDNEMAEWRRGVRFGLALGVLWSGVVGTTVWWWLS